MCSQASTALAKLYTSLPTWDGDSPGVKTKRQMRAPIAAPARGASQNIHSCEIAAVSAKRATAVERAGLTEVLVTGIEMRWINASPIPMVRGANPAGAARDVEPSIMIRKPAVSTISAVNAAASVYLPGDNAP